MPQNCPHCGMWLPRSGETHCPQCNDELSKPPVELDEEEDEEDEKPGARRSPLDKMVVVGNVVQFVSITTFVSLVLGGLIYCLFGAVARKQVGSSLCFLVLILFFVGLCYAIVKNLTANMR